MVASLQMAMILLLGGLFVLVLEMFIPSGGVLFFMACVGIIGSVIVAFMVSPTWGALFLLGVLGLATVLPKIFFEVWRRSPVGRRMLLGAPTNDDEEETEVDNRRRPDSSSLRGQIGKTLTPLRPVGISEIDGRRVDTVAEGVMIDRGEYVRVIEVEGNRVVVRRIAPEEIEIPSPNTRAIEQLFDEP